MLPPHYLKYREVFDKADFDTLPERRPWDHTIELTADFKPVDCKVYPLTKSEQVALKEFLHENLRTGRIRTSFEGRSIAGRFVDIALKNRHFPGVGAASGLVVPCAGCSNKL